MFNLVLVRNVHDRGLLHLSKVALRPREIAAHLLDVETLRQAIHLAPGHLPDQQAERGQQLVRREIAVAVPEDGDGQETPLARGVVTLLMPPFWSKRSS
ncbi:MAG TPA: hypothetical protein VI793_15620 [Anaerolineales bacterium]|nr:hypothetical protein [Anaerolineales bacterium]